MGQQLRWFVQATAHLPIPDTDVDQHFASAFLQQVPATQLNTTLTSLVGGTKMRLVRLMTMGPTALVAIVRAGVQLKLRISVDGVGMINTLVLTYDITPPVTWAELDHRLAAVAPDVSFLATEVSGNGQCRPIHSVKLNTPRPIGSMFKLYVLGALATRIRAAQGSWTQLLTIEDRLKSLPTGVLQNLPVGATIAVEQAATDMITISDNTAADHLIALVGREAVQTQARQWSSHANLNIPFLTTRELFILKYADYPMLADRYLGLDANQRGAYLANTIDQVPLTDIHTPVSEPRDINTIEWNASANDVCRALSALAQLSEKPGLEPIGKILSVNDGGLRLDSTKWPTVWFKGGSEPGVLSVGYLARAATGRTFVVTALTENPHQALKPGAVPELLSLVRGAFTLLH